MAATKKPSDHKPAADDVLTFDTARGEVKVYPLRPSTGFLRRNRKLSQQDQMWTLIEEFAGEEALKTIDQLDPGEELGEFMKAWEEASGIELGE